jgi:formylglycine-generating enzyme required for sulfatase activity
MGSSAEEKSWAATQGLDGGFGDKPSQHKLSLKDFALAVADEAPQHKVSLGPFALGKYDVTRREYAAFVNETGHRSDSGCYDNGNPNAPKRTGASWKDPGFNQTDNDPVICVRWDDAQAYVSWLNRKLQRSCSASGDAPYRLPSESEWEYAARAGSTTRFWWGDDESTAAAHAWYKENSGGHTHQVGLKPANRFGLYDMAGNVWQWTQDCYTDTYAAAPNNGTAAEVGNQCLRVDRGGSWYYPAWLLRPATRERNLSDYRDKVMGFRVARNIAAQQQTSPEPPAPRDAQQLRQHSRERAQVPAPGTQFRDCCNGCPEMVMLPQGSFVMGAAPGEEERENVLEYFRGHSIPQHSVTIQHSFAIAKFDVARDEYAQFVAETNRPDPDSCYGPDESGGESDKKGANWHSPGFPQTGRDPVVCVNWDDAQAYAAWLSAKTGHAYRLPTESEWEYAARAGTTTARYGSDRPAELCRYINHADLDFSEQHPRESGVNRECRDGYAFTSPVGSFTPNQFGLYDMLGNVWQWTEDCWNDNYDGAPSDGSSWQNGNCGRRVERGGAYSNIPGLVLSAVRGRYKSSGRDHSLGFRVARTF